MTFARINFILENMVMQFLYICANPFIYALKFDPVRRILKGLILCKNEVQATAAGT